MKTSEISKESKEIYFAIKHIIEETGYGYCQSWWLNSKNISLGYPTHIGSLDLSTKKINQRAQFLIKKGLLIIDTTNTSTSMGICYRLTNKSFLKEERKEKLNKIKWEI